MGFNEQYGTLLTAIADEADAMAMRCFRDDEMRVERKKDGTALTEADGAIEAMARSRVAASGLRMDVLGEEMGAASLKPSAKSPKRAVKSKPEPATILAHAAVIDSPADRARLIIDPIDGTEEFSRGIPTFGTLLAVERDGEIVAGLASAPALNARWWAYRNEGAYRNGKRIHVSDTTRLSNAMVFTTGTGPSKNSRDRACIRRLSDAARNSRALGGFWQHMLVAEGAIDAALDWTSKPWDLAPLGIIVEEAGGRSTNLRGQRTIYTGSFLSTNGKLHDEVLALLR
jgi:histidinol-phosphatase